MSDRVSHPSENRDPVKSSRGQFRWLWLTVLVFIADVITKAIAQHSLLLYQPVALFPGFNWMLAYNSGAAFSFLNGQSLWHKLVLMGISVAASVAIMIWLSRLLKSQRLWAMGLCLILGGALGNLYDRVVYGAVIDFIDVYYHQYHWPTFNVADSAICVGAGVLILTTFIQRKKHHDYSK